MNQDHQPDRETQAGSKDVIRLPTPTAWPIFVAFGLVLMCASIVTNMAVGWFGFAAFLVGAIGWGHDVFPGEQHEDVALLPESERARKIQPRPAQVDHLQVGEGQHRVRIPEQIHPYSAGVRGGIAGGVVMAVFAALHGLIDEDSLWYPVNLLAAVAMPSMADASLEQLKQFNGLALTVCIVVHGLVSVLLGLIYGVILPMLPSRHFLWGAIALPLMWTGLVGATLGVVNPVLQEYVDWPWFIAAQVAFGVTTGLVVMRSERISTLQTWPLAARAGIEAGRAGPEDRS